MKKEDILRKGAVEAHAKVGGIRQLHELKVTYEKTVWGMVPYLVSKHKLPTTELLRLAEELQLPIKCHGITAFPKGKAPQDFAKKGEPEAEEEKKGDDAETKETDDQKPERKVRKKMLSHDVLVKEGESGENAAEAARIPEAAESVEKEPEALSVPKGEMESAPAPTAIPTGPRSIEIETAPQPDAKKDGQEQKEEQPKEKRRTFSDNLLSEGILR